MVNEICGKLSIRPFRAARRQRRSRESPAWFGVLLALGLVVASDAAAADHKLLAPSDRPSTIEELVRRGARQIATRGSYVVLAAPDSLTSGDPKVVSRDDFDSIRLRRRRLVSGESSTAGRQLALVQFDAPPTDDDLIELSDLGVRIVEPIPQNAYLVWIPDPTIRRRLDRLPQRDRWQILTDFETDDAIDPRLDARPRDSFVDVTVQIFASADTAKDDVASVRRRLLSELEPMQSVVDRYLNLRGRVRSGDIADIAALASVINIEPYARPELHDERQGQIVAGNLTVSQQSPAAPGYLEWLAANGFSTDPTHYPIVAVVDDGIDNGGISPLNPELRELGLSHGSSRIVFATTPPGSGVAPSAGPDGHGTLNASILSGYNSGTGPSFADAAGFRYGLGVSPFGRLGNVRIFSPHYNVGNGTAAMVSDYYARGARIASNSWGTDLGGSYDSSAQAYDALVRDAQPSVSGNQELAMVFSGGNAGPKSGTIGTPGSAKNVLTVGASEGVQASAAVGTGCGDVGSDGDDARDLTSFSARGPCDDGRIKPDVVAPGTFIQGAVPQPTFTGAGVCGRAGNDYQSPGDDALFPIGSAYTWSSGTSHATPSVSAYASLVQEFLPRVYGLSVASPALLKAYIVHSARYLDGANAGGNLPGPAQGFGRVDAGLGFRTAAPRLLVDQQTVLAGPGSSAGYSGQIVNPSEPVRIVLAWTDAPGSTVGNAFVNDLDLTVTVGGVAYRGNNFAGSTSQPNGTPDTRNNVEAVFLPAGTLGGAVIHVDAITVSGDGVPGNGDATDQDFALVAYNFAEIGPTGSLVFDREDYACSDNIRLTLTDSDLRGSGSAAVTLLSSRSDAEVAVATESPAGSGIFTAAMPLSAGFLPIPANGSLQVADGDTVTATYLDASSGGVTATAVVDCLPPNPSGIRSSGITGAAATIAIESDEVSTATIRYGTDCADLSQSASSSSIATSHEVLLAGLSPNTSYSFVVDLVDAAGNRSTADNGGACYQFLTTGQLDYFSQLFESGFDLANHSITFTPDGSASFYRVCETPASTLPVDPAGGSAIPLEDDDFRQINLGSAAVSLYGQSYSSVFVGSNGYLTFGNGDAEVVEDYEKHFALPRISALFDDLDPNDGGISWKQLSDRVVVTWLNVPQFGFSGGNTFQIELFLDGVIRITYLGITAADGLAGLSAGHGIPGDFVPSDISGYAPCPDSVGSLSLDRRLYSCREPIEVQVHDGDLKGSQQLTIDLSVSGGDVESLLLTEDGDDSGTFRMQLPIEAGAPVAGDGRLQVDGGQRITASYFDADDGSGRPATVSASAFATCLDSFTIYRSGRTSGSAAFYKFGPVTLANAFGNNGFVVSGVDSIAVPGQQGERSLLDPATRYREYGLKLSSGTKEIVPDVHVLNECSDIFVQLQKPDSLLVPAALASDGPVAPPPATSHDLDHLLCYRSRLQTKLSSGQLVPGIANGMQVEIRDELDPAQTRRYDLLHVSRVCVPTEKSGTPLYLNGPAKGSVKTIAAATVRDPAEGLVCYRATLARKAILQSGCVPANPSDSGSTIEPAQPKHPKLAGLHVNDQFGPGQIDTAREREVCIPSVINPD